MPGIVGLIGKTEDSGLFKKMMQQINHFNYKQDTYNHQGVFFGRLHLNYVNREKQPVFTYDKRYALIMIGELFSYDGSPIPSDEDHSSFFLRNYLINGMNFLSKLNGHFTVSIYDFLEDKLILISDRLGTRPHYYTKTKYRFAYSPELKGLIELGFKKDINYQAVSELFRYGHLLGDNTLFVNAKQIPPASCLIYQNGKINIYEYWSPSFTESAYISDNKNNFNFNYWSERLYHLLKQGVNRNLYDSAKRSIFFPFSAGLDSRWVVALSRELNLDNIATITFGPENCEDQVYAEKVANLLSTDHYKYSQGLNPNRFLDSAKRFSYFLDGIYKIQGHFFFYDDFYRKYEARLSGQGSNIFGGTLHRRNTRTLVDKESFNKTLINNFINIYKIIDESWLPIVFAKDFYREIKGQYLETLHNYINKYRVPLYTYYIYLLKEHIRRGTFGGNLYSNLFYETRMPTLDNDLVDFSFEIPLNLKKNRYLYRKTFTEYFPELAKIPRDGTGLPLDISNTRIKLNRYKKEIFRRANKSLLSYLINSSYNKRNLSYTNYSEWFRNELKDRIENILLEDKTLNRGIYNEKGIRKILELHQKRKTDHSNLILQLLNLEFFFRNFFQ